MTKKELEEEKLKLEVADLKRHWVKKPQYLQVLLPTTLAIFSLLYAITTGLFSSKQELLELNKKRLETDIFNFQKEKKTLTETNKNLKKQTELYNDSLQNKNLILKKYENSFTKERQKIQLLNEELITLKNTRDDYNAEIKKLENDYNTKKKKYLDEIESKYYKEIDNDKKLKELKNIIDKLNSEIKNLKYNIEISKNSPFIQKGKQLENSIWTNEKMIEYYKSKDKDYDIEIQKLEKEIEKSEKKVDSLEVKRKISKIK